MNVSASGDRANYPLRQELLPTAWCAGCGIGSVAGIFAEAVKEKGITADALALYSGIGCASRIPDTLDIAHCRISDSMFINALGRSCDSNNGKKAVVFLDNADIMYTGLEDWVHLDAGQDMLFIHTNNLIYVETANGVYANTPFARHTTGKSVLPFNMSGLAIEHGARFVARWTPLQIGWMKFSIIDALGKNGFSYIELLTPCVVLKPDSSVVLSAADRMLFYDRITRFSDPLDCQALDLRCPSKIAVGLFADR